MTVTTEDGGRTNMYAVEPRMYISDEILEQMDSNMYETHNEKAEKLNGRLSMCGITLGMISYFTTGTLAFGLF
jgi:hypothetical protein